MLIVCDYRTEHGVKQTANLVSWLLKHSALCDKIILLLIVCDNSTWSDVIQMSIDVTQKLSLVSCKRLF